MLLILDIISRNLDFFTFEKNFSQSRFKRFSELAIFFHYISKDKDVRFHKDHSIISNYLGRKMERLSEDDIFSNFYTAYHLIMPYAFIRQFHYISHLEAALSLVCQTRFFSPETPPHRQMEWEYMLYHSGYRDSLVQTQDSILTQNCYLPFIDRDLAYAMTHALFYLTDFGFYEKPSLKFDCDLVGFRIACLAARFGLEKDLDVLLELAIGFIALYPYMTNRKHADIWFADLIELVEKCLSESAFLAFDISQLDEALLEKKYHTLFVLAILQTLLKVQGYKYQIATEKNEIRMQENSLVQAWRIIESLRKKDYSADAYHDYCRTFGRIDLLEKEIGFYIGFMKRRNDADILWRQEFSALQVPANQQTILSQQSRQDLDTKMAFHS